MTGLTDLPSELLAEIAIRADVPTVINLCAVSRQLRAAIRIAFVFKELLDRSQVTKTLMKRWTDELLPLQPSIGMWQRCAMADHRALAAIPHLTWCFSQWGWYIPEDVSIPHIAPLAILKHPYVTKYAWRQVWSEKPVQHKMSAAFAMIVSALIVREPGQWSLLANTNADYLYYSFDLMSDQVMTLRDAILFIHDILMINLLEYDGSTNHPIVPFVEPPTLEQFHLPPWTQSERFEEWHSRSVEASILDGAWTGCIVYDFIIQERHTRNMESSFVSRTEQALVRVSVKHDARSYELEGSPTRDSTAFELAGIEHIGSYAEGQRVVWKCMLTVFGITGAIWGVHEGRFKYIAAFWLWKDSSSTESIQGADI